MAYKNACAQKESKQALIDKQNKAISIKRQCELLGFPRSSYYTPKSVKHQFTEEEERAMQIMDATHTKHTCYGARSHSANLARWGITLNDAINMFLVKSIEVGGLPFDLRPEKPSYDAISTHSYKAKLNSEGVAVLPASWDDYDE